MVIGAVAAALLVGGCSSDDDTKGPAEQPGLCEKIGVDALRKALPTFEPDPPGAGDSTACVRMSNGATAGDFLRITVEGPAPGVDEACKNLEREAVAGETWLGPDQLPRVGDFACGTVAAAGGSGAVVTILSRRGDANVTLTYGRSPGELATVREAGIELARAVMRRI